MNTVENDDIQLSPCIISKAKLALGLKELKGKLNSKKCSTRYWEKVVNTVGYRFGVSPNKIESAIKKHNEFCQ